MSALHFPPAADSPATRAVRWIVRLGEVFSPWAPTLFERLGCSGLALAPEFWLLRFTKEVDLPSRLEAAVFRWCLPVGHAWPVNPRKFDGFIEKGTRALAAKAADPAGPLSPSPRNAFVTSPPLDAAMKTLASNFRGRLLQVLPSTASRVRLPPPEEEEAQSPVLQVFLCPKGLYAGVTTASHAKSRYPGGTKFVQQSASDIVSRAGAKLVEALTLLPLRRFDLPPAAHWLELGASPGGMTAELLKRGFQVTALDRAPLAPALSGRTGLTFRQIDVSAYTPNQALFHALLCDMNGLTERSLEEVLRLSRSLAAGAPVLFTLKFSEDASLSLVDALTSLDRTERLAHPVLDLELVTHSTYNRHELTCLFRKR